MAQFAYVMSSQDLIHGGCCAGRLVAETSNRASSCCSSLSGKVNHKLLHLATCAYIVYFVLYISCVDTYLAH